MKFLIALSVLFSFASHAAGETLMISINHSVPADEVQAYTERLNRADPTTGTNYFQAKVIQYIDFTGSGADYHGVALVELENHGAPEAKAAYMRWLADEQARGVYTLYSNGPIEPTPVIGGRNGASCKHKLR